MTQGERIVLSSADNRHRGKLQHSRCSKRNCHRGSATGRFLGIVGFLLGNPRCLFFNKNLSYNEGDEIERGARDEQLYKKQSRSME